MVKFSSPKWAHTINMYLWFWVLENGLLLTFLFELWILKSISVLSGGLSGNYPWRLNIINYLILIQIFQIPNKSDGVTINGNLDQKRFEQLVWFGHCNHISNTKAVNFYKLYLHIIEALSGLMLSNRNNWLRISSL